MPIYKYAQKLGDIPGCPPHGLTRCPTKGFRFARKNPKDQRNFLPVAVLAPGRRLQGKAAKDCCGAYALSMFETLEQLRKRATSALRTAPNFLKRVGDHYMELGLLPTDGQATTISISGHFDVYEHAGVDVGSRVKVHGVLVL